MDTLRLLRGIRFVDSLFPSGGYAFSSGLEAAVHAGAVTGALSLERYVADLLENGLASREAVALALAHDAALAADLDAVVRIDQDLEAMSLVRETRLASRQMGRQVIRIAAETDTQAIVKTYAATVEAQATPGHLPVSLGVTFAASGWTKREAIGAFLYQATAGLVSAGMKLLPVGQRDAQRILASLTPVIARRAETAAAQREPSSFVPLQDIYAMRHSRLASRLFRS